MSRPQTVELPGIGIRSIKYPVLGDLPREWWRDDYWVLVWPCSSV